MLKLRSLITALALAAALVPAAYAAYSDKTFTVTNTGNGMLTVTGATVSGNTAEFALTGNTCTSISPGGTCALTVRFTPSGGSARPAATLNFTSNATNGPSHSIALSGSGAACSAGKQVFSYTGADQVIAVPAGCSTATIKAWGAGGRGGYISGFAFGCPTQEGGGGGFAQRTLTGLTPGSGLTVVAGGGGAVGAGASYGGGGAAASQVIAGYTYLPGTGGGMSGVFAGSITQANALIIAGGGGGGLCNGGGAGGGSSGVSGGSTSGGGGGTSTAGGVAGYYGRAGGALQGASGPSTRGYYATGGGGGWFGGGNAESPAGGGSGYAPSGTLIAGSGCSVANSTDPDYVSGVGNGGCSANTSGQNGLVVIQWGP